MEIIFEILCGCLYVIGLVFEWNYKETSVYICIYLWPILCVLISLLPTVALVHNIIYNRRRILSIIGIPFAMLYTTLYSSIAGGLIEHYEYSRLRGGINAQFNQCMRDLQEIASMCETTYAMVNLKIYVELFIIILIANILIYYLLVKNYRK